MKKGKNKLKKIFFSGKTAFWAVVSGALMLPGLTFALQGETTLKNPLKVDSVAALMKAIADIIFQIGFVVAAIFIILSGFKFVTARGKPEELAKARSMFMWTILGTAILLGAVIIADVIQTTVQGLK
ncbi:MAG: hypothetical protein GXP44_00250 [bacterium]|nr:hypothetical protein [bacterium]